MSIYDRANKDPLTMCYSKDFLYPLLEKTKAELAAYKKPFSIMLIDIDGFKSFNDKHGHIFGDEALKYFSSSLRLNLEDEDCAIIRFGGDEFVIVFPGRTSNEVHRLAVNMENNIKNRPFLFKGREYNITFSGGIASCPHDGIEAEDVLEKADKAMYFSKRHGTGRISQYSRIKLESAVRSIIIILSCIAVISFLFAASHFYKIDMKVIRDKIKMFHKIIPVMQTMSPARLHLKTGGSLEGYIVDENDKDVFFRFSATPGEGVVIIKKEDVKYVDRNK